MDIRIKLALGFTFLTVVIISAVSFWAAQSLGVTIDISDLSRLESLKNDALKTLKREQQQLDQTSSSVVKAIGEINFFTLSDQQQQNFAERLKSSLAIDWLEIFVKEEPIISGNLITDAPKINHGYPIKLSDRGPYSYHGYIVSKENVEDDNHTLYIARRPLILDEEIPLLYIFNQTAIIWGQSDALSHSDLIRFSAESITQQIEYNEQIYRVRTFSLGENNYILTGYPAQRAAISRNSINELMLRIAVIEVIGLLVLGFFLARKLLFPLTALRHAIDQVAAGHWTEIPLNENPMKNSGEEITAMAKSFNNMVRELAVAQKRLIHVQKELAQKEKMAALGRFSAGIAHEINNPLGTILLTAGLIKEALEKGYEVTVEEVEEIAEQVKRCRDIIETLRTYTTKKEANLKPTTLESFIKNIVNNLREQNEFDSLNFELKLDFNAKLLIDEQGMYQVFSNLARNSLEALQETDNKTITIICEYNVNHIVIRFQDRGKGFENNPEHFFEPLFTTKDMGMGLGLVICQAIVEGHNGTICARRVEDEISEFSISLPLIDALTEDGADI